jgi:hypothetical protein
LRDHQLATIDDSMDGITSSSVDVDVDDVEEEALLPSDERLTYASFRKHGNLNELLHIYGLHKNQPVSPTIIAAWQWRSFRAAQTLEPVLETANVEIERKGSAKSPQQGERKDAKSSVVVAPEEDLKVPTSGPEFPEGEGRVYLGLSIYYTGVDKKKNPQKFCSLQMHMYCNKTLQDLGVKK